METTLHRQLKALYARAPREVEVPVAGYRIDVVRGPLLVEIQHASLASIRDKVRTLLQRHRVLVVKPIVAAKTLVQQDAKGGRVVRRRRSPKHGTLLSAFDELVHFTTVFPHQRLALELVRVEVEEWRYPCRHRRCGYRIEDRRLVRVLDVHRFRAAADLCRLVPQRLPQPFHTGHLAQQLNVDRTVAQRVAYCLRKTGAVCQVGQHGNTRLYAFAAPRCAA
ncbi:MAG: hypothetical protein A2W31_06985 [Planctomycetes bacterium RBG_16_64_10]|nr:MAG: hypothetical protein A2W31_06985 [Planctomycetes bacterium RBG_16_64_10]